MEMPRPMEKPTPSVVVSFYLVIGIFLWIFVSRIDDAAPARPSRHVDLYLDGFHPAAISRKPTEAATRRPANLTDDEVKVFECFRGGAILSPDALAAQTGFGAAQLSLTLVVLEFKRLIAKRADGTFEARG
jgi:hypothetical protein